MAENNNTLPEPILREEKYLSAIANNTAGGGGGGKVVIAEKSITANGTYNASSDNANAYNPVTVNVANSYTAGDEGKVVSSGALVSQTSTTTTTNGILDTTLYNSVDVQVPTPSPTLVTKNITTNGTYNASSDSADGYSSVTVNVVDSALTHLLQRDVTTYTVPSGITKLGDGALARWDALTSVTVPSGVTEIGKGCFEGDWNLTSVTLPETVTTIGKSAFYGCEALTSLDIPASVTSIGNMAFSSCTALASLKFKSTTPPTLGYNALENSIPTTCIIYIPTGTYSAYTSASGYPSANTYIEY